MNEKFYTPKQVAEILQVHQYTVLKWIREGKLRALKFGRVYRTTESEIRAFLGQTAHESAIDIIHSSVAGQSGNITLAEVTLPIPEKIPSPVTEEDISRTERPRAYQPPPIQPPQPVTNYTNPYADNATQQQPEIYSLNIGI